MSAAEVMKRVRTLPRDEQRRIAEQIWAELGDDAFVESPEMLAELDRRAEEFRKNPDSGLSWEEVRAEVRQRFRWK